ncbi:MAG: sensor histidine kinase [Bacteriovoracia bacterium]
MQEPTGNNEILIKEIERLKRVNEALMDRVEKGIDTAAGGAFSLFEKNVHLGKQVKERTLELEKLATELGKEKTKLSGIIQTLPGSVLFFDNNLLVDSSLTPFLKAGFNSVHDHSLEKILGPDLFQLMLEKMKLLGQTQEVVLFDFLKTTDSEENYYACSISSREKNQYVLYIQDNTVKYQQEKLIKLQEAKIQQSSKLASLGEMAAGVAHEINNPLAIINTSAYQLRKLLQRNNITIESLFHLVDVIENTVTRISKIITVMRDVSRENKGFIKEEVLLMDILNDVLALCAEKFKFHGIDLRLKISEDKKDHSILCDRLQFSQVLLNLLNNAYDATEGAAERWIELAFIESSHFDILMITDSGKGIPKEIATKIFNPFFTTKEVGKGTGLGLSISKSIMEKHNGSIELLLDSDHTCFVLKLPKA